MSESDSFEQGSTDGISEQVDALKGFLDEKGLAGGSAPATDSGGEGAADRGGSSNEQEASFESAVSAVESRWTSHGGEAPEHEPVAVHDTPDGSRSGDGGSGVAGEGAEGGWHPVIAPDGEELDESGGSSDGSESGQDGGSMS